MCSPQHVDKNGTHNILTDARVLVFGIYVSILLLPCLWAGCLGLDVEKMMPTNEDLHSPLFYGSASLQPPPHQQKEVGNVTPHFQASNYIALDCIVLYGIVLYCMALHFNGLHCIESVGDVWNFFIVLYCIVLYCIVWYCIVLYCIVM